MNPLVKHSKRILSSTLIIAVVLSAFCQKDDSLPGETPLWQKGLPDNPIQYDREEMVEYLNPLPGSISGRARRVSFISEPAYTIYPAPEDNNTGVGMVICPGGAYRFLSFDMEGHDIALYLQSKGITSLVLKYRTNTPSEPEGERFDFSTYIPEVVKDGRKAVQTLREQSTELGIAPGKVGMMGFSAGAHLTISTSLSKDEDKERTNGIPDFVGLIYPGIPDNLPEKAPKGFPPAFIMIGMDDAAIPPEKIVDFFKYLTAAGHKPELHMYGKGPHGRGMSSDPLVGKSMLMWPESYVAWIRDITGQ